MNMREEFSTQMILSESELKNEQNYKKMTASGNIPSLRGTKQSRIMKHEETYNNEGRRSLCASILDCFGRASLAMTKVRVMTRECLMTNNTVSSLRGTKQSRMMKHEETYNNEGRRSLCASILDCFGRASLAMTSTRVMTRECLTMNSRCPSLRGTKQSRRKKYEETYNNEGCWSLFIAGILDCFGRTSLAMTRECLTTKSSIDREAYRKNNCQLSTTHCRLNKNHSLSFNQTNHSSDKMTTGEGHQSCSSSNPVNYL
jgi:hypothetical protein